MNPDVQNKIEEINTSVGKINSGLTDTKITPLKPITPESISGNVPVIEPPAPIGNEAVQGELAKVGTQAEQDIADMQAAQAEKAKAAETDKTTSLEDLVGSIAGQETAGELQQTAEDEFGVAKLEKEVQNINNQILSEQRALQKTIEEIEANPTGALAGKVRAQVFKAESESLRRQADLSVIQLAAQGKFDSAAQRADRYATALYDRQQNVLNAKERLYNDYKDLFNKEEQRQFEINYSEAQRKLETERADQKTLQSVKLEAMKMAQLNGAPTEILTAIQNAQTPEDVLDAGGQYGSVDLLQRKQLQASIYNSYVNTELSQLKLKSEKAKQAELQKAVESGQLILDEGQMDIAMKLGKEYEGESSEFKKQVGAYNRITASAEDPSAAGDLALIFNYMKLLDPGSTVREGEFATAQNAAGVPEILRARFNQIKEGERLSEVTRNDFVERSTKLYNSALDQQIELENRYRTKSTDIFGLPEDAANKVIQDIRAVGSVSEIAFGLQLDSLSTDQMANLAESGLLPVSTSSSR